MATVPPRRGDFIAMRSAYDFIRQFLVIRRCGGVFDFMVSSVSAKFVAMARKAVIPQSAVDFQPVSFAIRLAVAVHTDSIIDF